MQQKSSILVVDDANTILHLMRHTLATAGYNVKIAANGSEALQLARKNKFDAVFTDIHMPEMDGISLIKALRALPGYAHIPILALTMANTDKIKKTARPPVPLAGSINRFPLPSCWSCCSNLA